MNTRYILQYKYELIGDGEWIDEYDTAEPSAAQRMMAKHVAEFPDMRCRVIKTSNKTEEVAMFKPLQVYKEGKA
jgi:hypothetical protein